VGAPKQSQSKPIWAAGAAAVEQGGCGVVRRAKQSQFSVFLGQKWRWREKTKPIWAGMSYNAGSIGLQEN